MGNHEEDKIRRRRAQLMVHSYLYYELDTPMVTDDKWQEWANELVALQREHPEPVGFFDDLFQDFDGSTGYHLTKNEWARSVATRLLMYNPYTRIQQMDNNHVPDVYEAYGATFGMPDGMHLVTIDFETFYSAEYTLTKMQTSEYIADPRFKVHMVGVKVDDTPTRVLTHDEFKIICPKLNAPNVAILCHHTHFDGMILAQHYGVRPGLWLDTLSMARAVLGKSVRSHSLDSVANALGVGRKMLGVMDVNAKGIVDLNEEQYSAMAAYCVNDVDLTKGIFDAMIGGFPQRELRIIDSLIRIWTEPKLLVDWVMLSAYLAKLDAKREEMIAEAVKLAGLEDVAELSSSIKFATALTRLGVDPPMKVSPATGKETYAFAKTDEAFTALLEHDNYAVSLLVQARLKVKSTIEQSRATRMVAMGMRGGLPIYLNYYGAQQTGRMSGGDKMNFQNLPRGGTMRKSIVAPRGKTIVVCDSANIEARVLDALAGKADALEVYRNADNGTGPDVYCVMAQNIYGYPVNKKDHPSERQMGKIAKLGLGYGMGSDKFVDAVRTMAGMKITKAESKVVVDAYRNTHREVTALWKEAETALAAVVAGGVGVIGKHSSFGGLAFTQDGIRLPNGTRIQFPKLHRTSDGFAYLEGTTPVNIYGGKVIENVVQALARIIVVDQILDASDEAGVPYCHMVHDEGLWVVDEDKADWMLEIAERHMRTAPKWWPDIPLNSEGSCARSYGDAK